MKRKDPIAEALNMVHHDFVYERPSMFQRLFLIPFYAFLAALGVAAARVFAIVIVWILKWILGISLVIFVGVYVAKYG